MSKLSNRLMQTSSIVISLVSFMLAILVSCIIMLFCGYDPIFAYSVIIEGSLGSVRSFTNTLIQATPLIFTGLAFMIGKKATLINLGVEGQMYTGAMVAALVGMTPLPLPGVIHLLGTDMHRMNYRPPQITESMKWLQSHVSPDYLDRLTRRNALHIINQENIR